MHYLGIISWENFIDMESWTGIVQWRGALTRWMPVSGGDWLSQCTRELGI